jgi:hypothetical protein
MADQTRLPINEGYNAMLVKGYQGQAAQTPPVPSTQVLAGSVTNVSANTQASSNQNSSQQ